MKNNLSIYLIYTYGTLDFWPMTAMSLPQGRMAYYQILYFFSDVGMIAESILKEVYEETLSKKPSKGNNIGPFESLNELNHYALNVCSELKSPEVFTLSVHDYNMALSQVTHKGELRAVFQKCGKKFLNPKLHPEKSNFFRRIFREG